MPDPLVYQFGGAVAKNPVTFSVQSPIGDRRVYNNIGPGLVNFDIIPGATFIRVEAPPGNLTATIQYGQNLISKRKPMVISLDEDNPPTRFSLTLSQQISGLVISQD